MKSDRHHDHGHLEGPVSENGSSAKDLVMSTESGPSHEKKIRFRSRRLMIMLIAIALLAIATVVIVVLVVAGGNPTNMPTRH